jgi:integrase
MKTSNRPRRGSILKKEPIRDLWAIYAIKELLGGTPRDFLLFVLAINTNLRACDLLALLVGQVRNLVAGSILVVRERKTGKLREITINRAVANALVIWLVVHPYRDDDHSPLFLSRKGGAIKVATLNGMVKRWCAAVGIEGRFGCHSLRKTFGYQHRVRYGTDLPTLQTMYGHAHQRQTLAYLCIQPDEIKAAYMQEI